MVTFGIDRPGQVPEYFPGSLTGECYITKLNSPLFANLISIYPNIWAIVVGRCSKISQYISFSLVILFLQSIFFTKVYPVYNKIVSTTQDLHKQVQGNDANSDLQTNQNLALMTSRSPCDRSNLFTTVHIAAYAGKFTLDTFPWQYSESSGFQT